MNLITAETQRTQRSAEILEDESLPACCGKIIPRLEVGA